MSSERHLLTGKILKNSIFKKYRIYEEVAVSDLVPFKDNRKHIDWLIEDLRVVIEVNGEQHYKPCAIGGQNARNAFVKQVKRDVEVQLALENGGYTFIEIPYWDELTEEYLINKISTAIKESHG